MDEPLLNLPLPEQRAPRPGDFDARPEAVRAFAAELPLAHTGETARRIHSTLRDTATLLLPWEWRLEMLRAFVPALEGLDEQLRRRFEEASLPLTGRVRLCAELLRELHRAFAVGHLQVAVSLLTGPKPRRWRDPLASALLAALHHVGRALLTQYQGRLPPAGELWRMLHSGHGSAVRHGVEQWRPASGPSLETVYKQVLLFASADPDRLRPAEAQELYGQLRREADAALLVTDPVPAGPLCFPFDPAADLPPGCRSGPVQLDPRPLCRVWNDRAPLLPPQLATLLRHWERRAGGRPERSAAGGLVPVLVGLGGVHRHLAQLSGCDAGEFTPACFAIEASGSRRRRDDPFLRAISGVLVSREQAVRAEPPPPEPEAWELRELDRRGARIARTAESPPRAGIQPGELVGLRCDGELHIGLVRWVRGGGEKLDAGIALVPGNLRPVAIQRQGSVNHRALMVCTPRGESLLLPSRLFASGEQLLLQEAGSTRPLELGRVLEEGAGYCRFGFEWQPEQAEEGIEARFEVLWGTL